jgi:hypothetical protein
MSWFPYALLGLALMVFIVLAYRRRWRWTGFAESRRKQAEHEDVQPAKTLWDWLQLLVIPLALAALAFLLNNSQSNREQRREDQRSALQRATAADAAREEALRAYLTQMSGLMLDRNLRSQPGADVRAVARTITVTVLRRLDGERKASVVRFLLEAGLLAPIGSPGCRRGCQDSVALYGADLRSVELPGAFLVGVDWPEVDLRGADLRGAVLERANLSYADLRAADLRRALLAGATLAFADLRGADLRGADLRGTPPEEADLRRADFRGADLRGADLRGADLREANLRRADFRGADLGDARYNPGTRWPRGFDPVAAGATERG